MYCPPKLPFFIKTCPFKLHNLLYIFICIVSLNYLVSLKNVPLTFPICYIYLYALSPYTTIFHKKCPHKLHNLLYIFICINIFCQYIDVQLTVLYPNIFLTYERTSVFYYNLRTRSAYASSVSSSRHDTKLNFVPVIPRVKELQSVTLTSSRGRCINYRPEASFY